MESREDFYFDDSDNPGSDDTIEKEEHYKWTIALEEEIKEDAAQMSPREVEMIHVYPWKRVIKEAGILGVMSSYNDYDGFPIQSSYYWLTTRLRGEFGFRGYVVSDSDAVEYLFSKHGTAADMKESVLQSVLAGLNIRCTFRSPDSYVLPLRELIAEGAIPMSTIDDRVLQVKPLLGSLLYKGICPPSKPTRTFPPERDF